MKPLIIISRQHLKIYGKKYSHLFFRSARRSLISFIGTNSLNRSTVNRPMLSHELIICQLILPLMKNAEPISKRLLSSSNMTALRRSVKGMLARADSKWTGLNDVNEGNETSIIYSEAFPNSISNCWRNNASATKKKSKLFLLAHKRNPLYFQSPFGLHMLSFVVSLRCI